MRGRSIRPESPLSHSTKIWTLADLHLAFGAPSKSMEVFGPVWKDYEQKIETHWKERVKEEDLVLVPGDISWAMKETDALKDLDWIDALPGTKLICKGNHDYWWPSNAKLSGLLPPSIHFVHNSAFDWNGIAFGGARLWDTREYNFNEFIEFRPNPKQKKKEVDLAEQERIFVRELDRLKLSLEKMNPNAKTKIALTHYPPIGADLKPSRASILLEDYGIDVCVFGHLHNVREGALPFGEARGVKYVFASADYLRFTPIEVLDQLEKRL